MFHDPDLGFIQDPKLFHSRRIRYVQLFESGSDEVISKDEKIESHDILHNIRNAPPAGTKGYLRLM